MRRDPAKINRGEVFWLGPDDVQEPVSGYSHPHVMVQDDVFNHSRITTVVACAMTSNLPPGKLAGERSA